MYQGYGVAGGSSMMMRVIAELDKNGRGTGVYFGFI
jgi:hypothetical protein